MRLVRSLQSGTGEDLAVVLHAVVAAVSPPVVGVISKGQHSIRKAVATMLPDMPHQLCHVHFLSEVALPTLAPERSSTSGLPLLRGRRRSGRERPY